MVQCGRWEDLKAWVGTCFISPYYRMEILFKFQQIQQGTRSVDERI